MEQKLTGRYIDPLTDWSFKHLFGLDPHKDILIEFLNDLFKGEKHITDIVYKSNEHAGDRRDLKKSIFDLLCTGDKGEHFIVEIQRGKQIFFRDRCIFYTSRLINEQLSVGKDSETYELQEVYLIAILDFTIEQSPSKQYLHDICLIDKDKGTIFYKKLGYKFLELPNFTKNEKELETGLDRWFYMLKNMSRLDKLPLYFKKSIFEKIFQIAEISNLTKEEYMSYRTSLEQKWDYDNVLAYAVQEEGKKKYGEGEKKGEIKGKIEGKIEGEKENKIATARKMKAKGYSFADIAEITDLSIEEIENL
ncbi:Rpn family recombination-promoting nuclease/putative transposase [Arcticibacter eurypsychrophilus]|uniref:Rpn family recombination-promoting nuclease/putative transposase n=1 Tax=Arcticibacter eurypsychrophilus TaxID=1434752 RepID=UPI00084DA1BE|nr:Rpn family recombination-promoting nuclease/putative transposase [Arcticibacter eurypsychrophilus]